MTLVGLDLNANRARAVLGAMGDYPLLLALGAPGGDLPLVLSLEQSRIEVGPAGERLLRRLPHLTCHTFLPFLGENHHWQAGKHRLDSFQATELTWRYLTRRLPKSHRLVITLPSYLSGWQADHVRRLAQKAGCTPLGSLPSNLAAALAGYAEESWVGSVLVVEIDEHALGISLVEAVDHHAHVREVRQLPHLSWRVWRERLMNALADCCVLQSRRDPRDTGVAEQGLYEQIELVLDACAQGKLAQLAIRGASWFQNLVVTPEQTVAFCRQLSQVTAQEIRRLLHALNPEALPHAILLTGEAARLPGLAAALAHLIEPAKSDGHFPTNGHARPQSDDDFGLTLLHDSGEDRWTVACLSKEACAQAAHGLGGYFQKGDLPACHLEHSAPLPLPWPVEAGPPRLSWQGREYFLDSVTFLLGSQTGCHFHVDPAQYPDVAARHCEIYYDHRTFVLFNRSRDGTWVNDAPVSGSTVLRPGDRIRLGASGPLMRFLGHA